MKIEDRDEREREDLNLSFIPSQEKKSKWKKTKLHSFAQGKAVQHLKRRAILRSGTLSKMGANYVSDSMSLQAGLTFDKKSHRNGKVKHWRIRGESL
jgi:long-subunit fatty acid transport protein